MTVVTPPLAAVVSSPSSLDELLDSCLSILDMSIFARSLPHKRACLSVAAER